MYSSSYDKDVFKQSEGIIGLGMNQHNHLNPDYSVKRDHPSNDQSWEELLID